MSASVRYELRLEIVVPVQEDEDPRDYITQREKSALEENILHLLSRRDGDVYDIEVMDAVIETDDENPRDAKEQR